MEEQLEMDGKKRRCRFPRWLKWILGVLLALILLVAGCITAVVVLLKPEHLTGLVEEYAPRFINGHVKVKRVELTFWHTFPRLTLDIDSLTVISNSLENTPDSLKSRLPEWADTLATCRGFHGTVNLKELLAGNLEIYDVEIDNPTANIVIVNDSINNFSLVPEEPDDTTSAFKTITIEKFRLTEAGPLRYLSLPDSIEASLTLNKIELDGHERPLYELGVSGRVDSPLLEAYSRNGVMFGFEGGVTFDFERGLTEVNVDRLDARASGTDFTLSTDVELGDDIVVKRLLLDAPHIAFDSIRPLLDPDGQDKFKGLKTDASAAIRFELTEPYVVDTTFANIPSGVLDVEIPDCSVKWPSQNLNIGKLEFATKITVDGKNLNGTRIEIPRLFIDGYAIDLDGRALITSPLINPRVAGELKGRVIIDRLPRLLLEKLPGTLSGTVGMNTKFRFKQSQLNQKDFHKIFADGTISLREFDVQFGHKHDDADEPDSLKLYTPLTLFRFSSDKKVESNGNTIDSLLTLTLTTDSLYYSGEGMVVRISNLEAALGTKNVAQSADTTRINPFGGRITIGRLRLNSVVDTTRLNLAGVVAEASLSRFEENDKVPLLRLNTQANRIIFGTADARVFLGSPKFTLTAHMNPRREHRRRFRSANDSLTVDSLRGAGVNMDSLLSARNERRRNRERIREAEAHAEDSLTSGLRNLLRRWDVAGELSAKRARLFTPMFPLRNSMSNLDLTFNTDTIQMRSLKLKAGASDFDIKGEIAGLKSSMSRRRDRSPMTIDFRIQSDTIDIDELSRAVFAGAAAQRDTTLWDSSIDENTDVAQVIDIDTTQTAPLIVSPEIDATLHFKAKNVIYTGMLLHDFKGELGAWDQAIHLHDLQARSPMGDMAVSALYNAPDVNNLEFGMGMQLLDFHIEKFLQLTPSINELLPAIKDFSGVIDADIALTTKLSSDMDFIIPSVQADVKIDGDSLVLLDADTFKSLSKWLLFKDKKHNMIDHMSVELQVDSSQIVLFPFIFNIDRYKLGVMGSNDLDMNLNYHVSVLKSPIPFKFGINITGNLDKMKIRLGGAKIKENTVVERVAINSDTRINLVNQLENVFRRGANSNRGARVHVHDDRHDATEVMNELHAPTDTLSTEQSAILEESTQ